MSYYEDLKHPLWQQRRLRVFELAAFTCVRCRATESQLHAHHKVYLKGRRLWDYPDDLLECLCDDCHERAHEQKSRLEIMVAQHPTSMLPTITRLMGKLGAAMTATDRMQRVGALNSLQDELDAIEDFRRGPGFIEAPAAEETQA